MMKATGTQNDGRSPLDLIDAAALARLLKTAPSTIEWLLAHDPAQLPKITVQGPFGPLWSHAVVVRWSDLAEKAGAG